MFFNLKKGLVTAFALSFAISNALCVTPAQAASKTLISNGWYYIKNVNSQKYVEVANGTDKNGANVQQYQGNGNNCQKWYLTNLGNNYVSLRSGLQSGRMMDVANGGTENGTNIQIYDANGKDTQIFRIKKRSTGVYNIVSKSSGEKLALDVYSWSKEDGGNINLWKASKDACQQFKFEAVNTDSSKEKEKDNNSGKKEEPKITGSTIEVKNGGTTLSAAISKAKSGTTIVINGTVKSGAVKVPAGVNIAGKNNAVIDFSSTSGSNGRGLTFEGNGSTVSDITIKNASDNGVYITGSNNTFKNVTTCYNHDAGFQVCNGGSYNKFYSCRSHHNADEKGENADGFANKLHSGVGNYYESCVAEYNSDDGWDCYAAHGAVTLVNCQANYNGYCDGIYGDGNGFKMGGVDNKTPGQKAHLDPLAHKLTGCIAKGNYASGFDRNNQSGVVTMTDCTAESNKKNNYNWPANGKPSALGYQVTFGKAKIINCTSINGKNNISGAVLSGSCKGF